MGDPRGDDHERRLYWTQQMDAAFDFMVAIQAYPVEECGDPLVSIPDAAASAGVRMLFSTLPHVLGLPRLYYLRRGIMDEFLSAAREMNARGWVLKIEDGFRTRRMQKHNALRADVFSAVLSRVRWELGGETPSIDFFRRRLAAIIAMSPSVGTHCCGCAVDVSVFARDEVTEIDRGASYLGVSEITPMGSPFVSDAAAANRAEISAIMTRHGFRAYPFEFWHYNKGDAYDGYLMRTGRPARYGAVDFDPATGIMTPIAEATVPLNSDGEISALLHQAMQQDEREGGRR
jgi:D-alanyl-D-alanine dipeptidase